MSGRILLLNHMPGERQDRAHKMLQDRGFETVWCSPALGDPLPDPAGDEYQAVVVYGGSQSANDEGPEKAYIPEEIDWIRRWVAAEKPYLGFCLGAQLLARSQGAAVGPHPHGLMEIGFVQVENSSGEQFLPEGLQVYHWHKEGFSLPERGELLLRGRTFPQQAFRLSPKIYGLQFHPEVTVEQMGLWMSEAGHMLSAPGAHGPARQLRDAARHNAPLGQWLEDFLDRWLEAGGLRGAEPEERLRAAQ
jgi:GMP synthase (glutamine-hydrolysing)